MAPFDVGNGVLEVQVIDMHRCFNLNSLAGNDWQQNLVRLKTLLRNRNVPDALADVWRDWVDADQDVHGFGAEDGDYLMQDVPYRAANGPAADVSELRLLKGMTDEYLKALGDTVCVLPTTKLKINVNTAGPAVLAAMSPGLSEAQMQSFTQSVRDYDSLSQVTSTYPDLGPAVDALSVSSEYFRINVRAVVDGSQVELSSLVRRDPSSGKITLISRDLGRNFHSLFTAADSEKAKEGG